MENETNKNSQENPAPLDPSIKFNSSNSVSAPQNLPTSPEPQIPPAQPVISSVPQPEIPQQSINQFNQAPVVSDVKYAGFWIRIVALFIDGLVLFPPMRLYGGLKIWYFLESYLFKYFLFLVCRIPFL